MHAPLVTGGDPVAPNSRYPAARIALASPFRIAAVAAISPPAALLERLTPCILLLLIGLTVSILCPYSRFVNRKIKIFNNTVLLIPRTRQFLLVRQSGNTPSQNGNGSHMAFIRQIERVMRLPIFPRHTGATLMPGPTWIYGTFRSDYSARQ